MMADLQRGENFTLWQILRKSRRRKVVSRMSETPKEVITTVDHYNELVKRATDAEAEVEQLISEHTHMGKMLAKTITDRHNACGEVERLKAIIKTDCEYEQEIRSLACNILSEFQVYGDSYGVPTLVDVVELLIEALKAQEVKG
jgi:CRISPR/Cas system-associated exonuclease Cas4 (RecB family)